ncbi:MAG: hypothetical protein Q8O66_01840 [bacterium]|nr:hypothetical protein [bacterium]
MLNADINVIALVKGRERYVFLYTDENCQKALSTLGRFVSNQELSFNCYDAAVLSQKIRQTRDLVKKKENRRFSFPPPPAL